MVTRVASCLFSLAHTLAVQTDSESTALHEAESIVVQFQPVQNSCGHIWSVFCYCLLDVYFHSLNIGKTCTAEKHPQKGTRSRTYIGQNQYWQSILSFRHSIIPPIFPCTARWTNTGLGYKYNVHFPYYNECLSFAGNAAVWQWGRSISRLSWCEIWEKGLLFIAVQRQGCSEKS